MVNIRSPVHSERESMAWWRDQPGGTLDPYVLRILGGCLTMERHLTGATVPDWARLDNAEDMIVLNDWDGEVTQALIPYGDGAVHYWNPMFPTPGGHTLAIAILTLLTDEQAQAIYELEPGTLLAPHLGASMIAYGDVRPGSGVFGPVNVAEIGEGELFVQLVRWTQEDISWRLEALGSLSMEADSTVEQQSRLPNVLNWRPFRNPVVA